MHACSHVASSTGGAGRILAGTFCSRRVAAPNNRTCNGRPQQQRVSSAPGGPRPRSFGIVRQSCDARGGAHIRRRRGMLSGIRIGKKAATASAPSPPDPPQQREQWMTGAFDRPATAGKRAADAPEPESAPRMKRPVDLSAAGVRPTKVVGDGGASWRRRMERRARERDSAASSDMSSHPLSINQGAVPAAPVRSRRSPERDPRRHDRAASSQRPSETTVDVDLNQLAAKAMRAKIAGNMAEHDRLQAEIDAARSRPRVEIVPDLDTRDRPTNLPARDADGIKAMVQEERMQSYADYQMQSAMAVVRDRRYAASTDDQFDAADESRFVSKDDKAKGRKPLNQRQPNENCWYCLGGPRFQHHLVVRVGKYCHIEVPSGPPLGLGMTLCCW